MMRPQLTRSQRLALWISSLIGFFGVNGLFLYAVVFTPALSLGVGINPVALAFIIEAFVLLGILCFLIRIYELRNPGWVGFLVLSLVGSLAFSVPVSVLLWSRTQDKNVEQ